MQESKLLSVHTVRTGQVPDALSLPEAQIR